MRLEPAPIQTQALVNNIFTQQWILWFTKVFLAFQQEKIDISDDTELDVSNNIYAVDASSGDVALTLPAASTSTGYAVSVKKIDNSSNTITVTTTNSETIDGDTNLIIYYQWDSHRILSNGIGWYIV